VREIECLLHATDLLGTDGQPGTRANPPAGHEVKRARLTVSLASCVVASFASCRVEMQENGKYTKFYSRKVTYFRSSSTHTSLHVNVDRVSHFSRQRTHRTPRRGLSLAVRGSRPAAPTRNIGQSIAVPVCRRVAGGECNCVGRARRSPSSERRALMAKPTFPVSLRRRKRYLEVKADPRGVARTGMNDFQAIRNRSHHRRRPKQHQPVLLLLPLEPHQSRGGFSLLLAGVTGCSRTYVPRSNGSIEVGRRPPATNEEPGRGTARQVVEGGSTGLRSASLALGGLSEAAGVPVRVDPKPATSCNGRVSQPGTAGNADCN
jgi:hypothetical protein